MISNTRFNPTVNGYLHLGHLYNILVNQAEARRSGGKFIFRFDDSQRYWNWKHGASVESFKWQMRDDMEWLGIEPDAWSSQMEMMPQVERLANVLDYRLPTDTFNDYEGIEVVGSTTAYYPANERLTAEHVLMDQIEGITCLIRGMDLITEANAYKITACQFGFMRVRQVYIPRLIFAGDVVSKTAGCYKVKDFRQAGLTPDEIVSLLEVDCLKDIRAGWNFENIKAMPILGKWAKEALYDVCN